MSFHSKNLNICDHGRDDDENINFPKKAMNLRKNYIYFHRTFQVEKIYNIFFLNSFII